MGAGGARSPRLAAVGVRGGCCDGARARRDPASCGDADREHPDLDRRACRDHRRSGHSDDTRIAVDRGTVTARLFHGAAHRLSLEGGGVTAVATGTVYTLAVAEHGAVVGVVQGTVEVRDSAGSRAVAGGATWPPSAAFPDRSAAGALLALSDRPAPPLPARVANAPPADAPAPDAVPAPLHPGTPAPSIKDRWHHARLLRGQGQFSEAIAECMAIAETRDATWAPIALLEAARIYLGPLSDPEHAIEIADRLGSQWPNDALAPEARDLRCRALGQLGRASECEARH